MAENMSDGTLRALGVLTAYSNHPKQPKKAFVGIEEPEVALHPGAADFTDALLSASQKPKL